MNKSKNLYVRIVQNTSLSTNKFHRQQCQIVIPFRGCVSVYLVLNKCRLVHSEKPVRRNEYVQCNIRSKPTFIRTKWISLWNIYFYRMFFYVVYSVFVGFFFEIEYSLLYILAKRICWHSTEGKIRQGKRAVKAAFMPNQFLFVSGYGEFSKNKQYNWLHYLSYWSTYSAGLYFRFRCLTHCVQSHQVSSQLYIFRHN